MTRSYNSLHKCSHEQFFINSSNIFPNFDFIKILFAPVKHSMSLDTLISVHFLMILGLFVIVTALILLIVYFYINLLIIFNKEFILNKIKNKYALMYVKYVLGKIGGIKKIAFN